MNNKRLWMVASMLIVLPLLASCAASDEDMLVGTWQLSNIETLFDEDGGDFSQFEEYVDLDLTLVFKSNGEFTFDVALMMDLQAMMAALMGDLGVEIEAENLDIQVSMGGTYEIESPGVLLLNLDSGKLTTSPEEFCFSVAGFESCQGIEEITGEFVDIFPFDSGTALYEVDETSLTIWDDSCDYPADQSCAAQFTK